MSLIASPALAKKPNIVIIATGGTIAGKASSAESAHYEAAKLSADSLIAAVPQLGEIAKISTQQFSQVGSQDFDADLLLKLSKHVGEVAARKDVDAIVITHGTDTMEESAYFLNLTVKTDKPIVLVGAMRPSNSLSADGPLNLYNAVAVASTKQAHKQGVLVVMNGEIFAARDVTKTNTTNVNAFAAPDYSAIGAVNYGNVEIGHASLRNQRGQASFTIDQTAKLSAVEIVYGYVANQSDLLEHLVEKGAKAIIYAGVGDGNINKPTLQKLSELSKKGVLIIRSSRVGSGAVVRNAEINDDEFGFVTAGSLNPQKARILAMLALGQTSDHKKIQKFFDEL